MQQKDEGSCIGNIGLLAVENMKNSKEEMNCFLQDVRFTCKRMTLTGDRINSSSVGLVSRPYCTCYIIFFFQERKGGNMLQIKLQIIVEMVIYNQDCINSSQFSQISMQLFIQIRIIYKKGFGLLMNIDMFKMISALEDYNIH